MTGFVLPDIILIAAGGWTSMRGYVKPEGFFYAKPCRSDFVGVQDLTPTNDH